MYDQQRDHAAFAQLFTDLVVNILALAESPGQCCEYITRQIRELIGVRTVLILQCAHHAGAASHTLLSVFPERRRDLGLHPAMERFAWLSHAMRGATFVGPDSPPELGGEILRELDLGTSVVLPLESAGSRVGVLFLLGIMDPQGIDSIVRSLDQLGPVLALILRNAYLYNNLEQEVQRRTEQLARSEATFREYVENTPDGIFITDHTGRFQDVNPAACHLSGYSRDELLQLSIPDLQHPDVGEEGRLAFQTLMVNKHVTVELPHRIKSGDKRYWQVKAVAMSSGKVLGFVSDVTERRQTQAELLRAKDTAEAANRAKSEFLANMSHEIRTPLNGVMGMLQLMEATELNPEQQEYAGIALQSCKRLTRLLADILDLSRIEAGKMSLQLAPLQLDEVLGQLSDLFLPIARETGVALECRLDPAIPRVLLGDATRLLQVLTNLVGNAFKFTPSGSVTVEVSPLPALGAQQYKLLFAVTDTGIGIPDDKLANLFEAFSQVSQGFTRKYQGAGLGLAICKRLVELMGGSITVDSQPGTGTTFYFTCVFRREAADAITTPPTVQQQDNVLYALAGLRILVAEDDLISGMVAAELLRVGGAVPRLVENGQEALEALQESPYDLVLMDVQMPVLDGVAATKAIRSGALGADKAGIPIIAMTAYAMAGDREQFLAAGMDGYIAKPAGFEELAQAIAKVLGARDRTASQA